MVDGTEKVTQAVGKKAVDTADVRHLAVMFLCASVQHLDFVGLADKSWALEVQMPALEYHWLNDSHQYLNEAERVGFGRTDIDWCGHVHKDDFRVDMENLPVVVSRKEYSSVPNIDQAVRYWSSFEQVASRYRDRSSQTAQCFV